MFNGLHFHAIHRRLTRMLYQQKNWQLRLKGQATGWNERRLLVLQNSTGRKYDKTTHLQICSSLQEKRMTLRVRHWVQRSESGVTEDYSQPLKPNKVWPVGFWNCLRPVALFLPWSPFCSENVCNCYPICIVWAHILICYGCYNKIPQIRWLINNRNLLLAALEAWNFKIKMLAVFMLGESLLTG